MSDISIATPSECTLILRFMRVLVRQWPSFLHQLDFSWETDPLNVWLPGPCRKPLKLREHVFTMSGTSASDPIQSFKLSLFDACFP
jgi:hypothetical protein